MTATAILSAPPQTGRATDTLHDEQTGLWSHVLTVARNISGAFDQFANDADPALRALGRVAHQRRPQQANDYFALGDMCAQRTLKSQTLHETYAAKAIAAYTRAGEFPHEATSARTALLNFAMWAAETGTQLGDYQSLKVGLLVCERVHQLNLVTGTSPYGMQLTNAIGQLHDQQMHLFESTFEAPTNDRVQTERESRVLCDKGQMLLRQGQTNEALVMFERAVEIDPQHQQAWIWRAMALTDTGNFFAALKSYDESLKLDESNAGAWNSKGALLMELGKLQPALDCFARALELSSAVPTVQAVYWLNRAKRCLCCATTTRR